MNDGSKDLNQTDEGDLLSAAEVSDEVRLPPSWCGEDFQLFGMALIALGALRGRRSAAKLLTKDEARRIAANIAKLPELLGRKSFGGFFPIRFSKPECRRLRPPWTPIYRQSRLPERIECLTPQPVRGSERPSCCAR